MLSVRRAICEAGGGGRSYQISIHALREEGDLVTGTQTILANEFLSAPSARRATAVSASSPKMQRISIHSLREEGDWGC